MSKAFTKDDAVEAPLAVRGLVPLEPGMIRYLTVEGEARFAQELSEAEASLRAVMRDTTVEAQTQRAGLEERVALLTSLLKEAAVVRDHPSGVQAFFGAWIEVEDEDGAIRRYRLVGPDETEPKRGLVSIHSPLGRALIGKSVGDVVEVPAPGGVRELTILRIES